MNNIYINNDTNDDATMRWRNTILGVDLEGDAILPFLVDRKISVDNKEKKYLMEGHIGKGSLWEPYVLDTSKTKSILPFPITGYFNINNYVYNYVSRHAHTTTRKGTLRENFTAPLSSMTIKGVKKINAVTIYKAAFNPIYLNKDTIIELIMSGKALGLALSNVLVICIATDSSNLRIYRNRYLIAEFNVKDNLIIIHKNLIMFKEELREYGFDNFREINNAKKIS